MSAPSLLKEGNGELARRRIERVAAWVKAANIALQSYEADNDAPSPDAEEFGRIPESRESPSFRITAGHIRALADLMWNLQAATSQAQGVTDEMVERAWGEMPNGGFPGFEDMRRALTAALSPIPSNTEYEDAGAGGFK